MDLGECEASFGLIIRDKNNHDSYILMSFENVKERSDEFKELEKKIKIIKGEK